MMNEQKGTEMSKTYKLPKRFIEDHASRFCLRNANDESIDLSTITVKETKQHITVTLTDAQVAELIDDARYYEEAGVELMGREYVGVVRSAVATLAALKK